MRLTPRRMTHLGSEFTSLTSHANCPFKVLPVHGPYTKTHCFGSSKFHAMHESVVFSLFQLLRFTDTRLNACFFLTVGGFPWFVFLLAKNAASGIGKKLCAAVGNVYVHVVCDGSGSSLRNPHGMEALGFNSSALMSKELRLRLKPRHMKVRPSAILIIAGINERRELVSDRQCGLTN